MKTVEINTRLFAGNRERLCSMLPDHSVAILHANDEMSRTADQLYPYRQNSDLFYFSGINQEKTLLLFCPDHPDKQMYEILFILKSDKKLETWQGHKLTSGEAQVISGIRNIKYLDELEPILATLMQYAHHVYINGPEHQKFIPDLPSRDLRFAGELQKKFPAHSYERLAPLIHGLRMVKSSYEIELVREACRITHAAFRRVLDMIQPGIREYDVEAEIIHEFIRQGAGGHAFHPIVASGKNACFLHYEANNASCHDGDLLLLDFGAEYGNYAADCSRTFPVNGRFTDRQKELYQSVLNVFKYARTLIKPGATINSIHDAVCRYFESEHIRLGLYTQTELDQQNELSPLYQQYYMHGTSHFLGLDVHDPGNKNAELKPGMILTCEPGIYLPDENTGIRLENDILVTEEGNTDLMEDIPIEAEEIEKLMIWKQNSGKSTG